MGTNIHTALAGAMLDWTEEVAERLDTSAGLLEHVARAEAWPRRRGGEIGNLAMRLRGLAAAARTPACGLPAFVVEIARPLRTVAKSVRACKRRWPRAPEEALADLDLVAEELDCLAVEALQLATGLPALEAALRGAA